MKFSDGNWLVPENLTLLHPVHVHEVQVEGAVERDTRQRRQVDPNKGRTSTGCSRRNAAKAGVHPGRIVS